jgi:hypothetical protein
MVDVSLKPPADDGAEFYLGDGLYASFDGWQFRLRAPRDDGDHVVYLDGQVFASFVDYARHVRGAG